ALLLVWRMFDKPTSPDSGTTIGLQWGIFVALLAAGALTAVGLRVRAAHRPEPPNPAAEGEDDWIVPPRRERPRRRQAPRDSTTVTEVLRERPGGEGEPPEAPRSGG